MRTSSVWYFMTVRHSGGQRYRDCPCPKRTRIAQLVQTFPRIAAVTDTAELSPLQRRALQVMGIDRYVTRGATSRATHAATSRLRPAPTPEAALHAQPAAAPDPADADASSTGIVVSSAAVTDPRRDQSVAVALDCLAGAGVVAIGTFATAADARFVQDVLAALLDKAAPLRRSAFKWPQTQTGDRSRVAAERAYAGFLNGQTERAGARLLLLLGGAATMLLPAERTDAGYAVVESAAIGDLRRDPAQKKALWLSIRRFASR
jgi:hypothetical protein